MRSTSEDVYILPFLFRVADESPARGLGPTASARLLTNLLLAFFAQALIFPSVKETLVP